MFVFGAALLLLLCSGSESERREFVREGDAAVLPCDNVQPGQERCNQTTWLFISARDSGTAMELINLGRTSSRVPQQRSERLSLTQDCGLQIKAVRSEEARKYICQQYNSSGTGPRLTPDAHVTLSVVSVTEDEKKNDLLTLSCSVSTSLESSTVKLKWLFNGREVDKDNSEIKPMALRNGLKVNIKKPHPAYVNKRLLKCEVTHKDQTHQFSLSSEETAATSPPPPETTSDEGDEDGDDDEEEGSGGSSGLKAWSWAGVAAAAVVLLLVALALFVWRRRRVRRRDRSVSGAPDSRGPRGERGEAGAAVEPEEVNYASINFDDRHRTEVRQSEEAVTYSSVRKNQAPDSQLYATVK